MTPVMKEDATPTERDPRWTHVVNRDASADGEFVYAVRTTGVYCRPSCPSRTAKPTNVGFYASPAEAEAAGYRACQRCNPKGQSLAAANAAVVVAGDVDPAEVKRLAEKYYGPIAARPVPPRKPRDEPAQAGLRRMDYKAPAEQSYLALSFKVPQLTSFDPSPANDDALALTVLAAVLDRHHPPRGEAAAIAAAIHAVHDGLGEIAASQEIRMQRVHHAAVFDGGARRLQRLAEHLPAEHLRAAGVAALAAEQVDLEAFEFELLLEVGEPSVHLSRT